MAERIQRRRTKGWRMPPSAVYVGRPSRWGNPFRVGEGPPIGGRDFPLTLGDTIRVYGQWLRGTLAMRPDFLNPLRGHDLVCWCSLELPCHADVLLEELNRG